MRAIQEKLLTLSAVVNNNGEAAGGGNHELLKFLVCMAASRRSRRNIVKIVNTLDFEWNVASTFDERQIAPLVRNFRQINNTGRFGRRQQVVTWLASSRGGLDIKHEIALPRRFHWPMPPPDQFAPM